MAMALLLTLPLLANIAQACTIVAVGKKASSTGYPLVTHTNDNGPQTADVRVTRTPRARWPVGSRRPLYQWMSGYPRVVSSTLSPAYAPVGQQRDWVPLATIPQVEETWAYWDMNYGLQNEWGLSMGESTCTAKTVGFPATPDNPLGYNHVGINDMSKIALERCKTARCAIQTMGDIAVEYGFYSEDSGTPDKPDFMDSGEALAIADADGEVWIFNVLTGKNNASAIWAAQRVPDDHVAAVGNSFTIRNMNLADHDNFMYSPDVTSLATAMGWWVPKAEEPDTFDFHTSYGFTPPGEYMKNVKSFYSGRRMWRIFSLLSPAEGKKLDPERGNLPVTKDPYPLSVPAPEGSVTREMVMDVLRDHYEGTVYDLTKGMGAGPFGNPNRASSSSATSASGQWERAISLQRTSWAFVCESKPGRLSVTWFGWGPGHGAAFLPFYGSADRAPPSFSTHGGNMSVFNTKVAWWAFNLIEQFTNLNFQLVNPVVLQKASLVQAEAMKLLPQLEATHNNVTELADMSNSFVEDKVAEMWEFAWQIVAKYGRYVITNNETEIGEGKQVYPDWWTLSTDVGYSLWTPKGPFGGSSCLAQATVQTTAHSSDTLSVASVIGLAVAWTSAVVFIAFRAGRRSGASTGDADVYYAHRP